uniref:RNA polymerase Rpb6 n=1 Tax=Pithovirus LCPAC103 TaxID=2506588 RepID=A0A481Z5U8_9VIRU|nr:MAG: RNA polymerase Rpb6 [Pithovirus LCPAC103]
MSNWRKFAKEDLILLPQAREMAYSRGLTNVFSEVAKWGQMKLWLTYVNLLNYYLPMPLLSSVAEMAGPDEPEEPRLRRRQVIMVVIGASPGYSIPLINKMYPGIQAWHIYDTQLPKFEALPGIIRQQNNKRQDAMDRKRWLKDPDETFGSVYKYYKSEPEYANVYWHNQFFEDREIDFWSRYNLANLEVDLLLVSDIRRYGFTSTIREGGKTRPLKKDEIEQSVLEDNWLQARAVQRIRPLASSLKFRPPWSDTRGPSVVDLVSEDRTKITLDLENVGSGRIKTSVDWLVYLDGVIMFQAYVGASSTETRLIVTDPTKVVRWRTLKYENQLSYHNRVTRVELRFYNPFIPETLISAQAPIDAPELLNNYDSVAATFSLAYYFNRGGVSKIYQSEMAIGLYRLAVLTFNRITGTAITANVRRLKAQRDRQTIINKGKRPIFEGPKLSSNLGTAVQPAILPAINVFPPARLKTIKAPQFRRAFPELSRSNFIFEVPELDPPTEPVPTVFGIQLPAGILKMVGAEEIPDLPGRPGTGGTVEVEVKEPVEPVPELTPAEIAERRAARRPPYWLTKYERAKVLGIRALQISKNAPPTIEVPPGMINSLDIAQLELEAHRLPLILIRRYPDGSEEEWPVSELALTPAEVAETLLVGF